MQSSPETTRPVRNLSLGKRALIGALIGLGLIGLFLLSAGEGKPGFHPWWRLRPLLVVPVAGALGACLSWFLDPLRKFGLTGTIIAIVLSLLAFVVCLWLGSVLGLAGTYCH